MIHLYNSGGSTCSQRVRFTLALKEIPYQRTDLNLLAGEHLSADYLRLNPNGVVPTLVHDDVIVNDSAVILEYLEEVFPGTPPLVPPDAAGRAKMRAVMRYIDEVPTASVRIPSFNIAFVRAFHDMSDEEFRSVAAAKPLRKEFMLAMGKGGFSPQDLAQSLDRLDRAMARIAAEIRQSGGPFVLGGTMSLADIAFMPTLVRLADIGLDWLWRDRPEIARLLALLVATPAYAETYYPGCHISDRYKDARFEAAG